MSILPTRVFDLLQVVDSRPKDQVIFSSLNNGQWREYSVSEYLEYSDLTSFALINYGISKGEPVISITHNRAEFNFADMGILQAGAVHVPLYPAIDVSRLKEIITETGARIAFISNMEVLKKIQHIPSCKLKLIVSFDPVKGAVYYEDFIRAGAETPEILHSLKSVIKPEDPASIIYLSGSNTPLKGVVLSHAAHIFNVLSYCSLHHMKGCQKSISFLPLAHSFERTLNYSFQYLGIQVCYSEGLSSLAGLLRKQKPEIMLAVPLVLERIVESVKQEMLKVTGVQGWLARMALKLAAKEKAGPHRISLPFKKSLFNVSFKGLRSFFGGRIKVMLCGGAALNPETLNILWAAGIRTYEGYGLTEAGPLVSYNRYSSFKSQSVGKLMPGVQVKISHDQEVLVRSGGIMQGYFKQGSSPFDADGWLHTGDIGMLDRRGFLTLTGTKKEIFKLSSGLYMDPRPIEKKLEHSTYIRHIFVYGHNRTFLTAVIIPGERTEPTKIESQIAAYNLQCSKYDQIVKSGIADDEWSVENGLLNEDGSLNRYMLYVKYRDVIENMYA